MSENRMLTVLPPHVREYKEIEAVCDAELPEFDQYSQDLTVAQDDLIIQRATEHRISEWEEMLNIVPVTDMSLDNRKTRLQQYMKQLPSFALREIIVELSSLSASHTVAYWVNYPEYTFGIKCDIPNNLWDIYYEKLKNIVPANMILDCVNTATKRVDGTAVIVSCMVKRKIRRIS